MPEGDNLQPAHLKTPIWKDDWMQSAENRRFTPSVPGLRVRLTTRGFPQGGVFEIALPFRGNAFRVIYAVQIGIEIWVLHAFQKKSTQGVKTPKHEIDLVSDRLKRLKEMLK